MFGKSLYKEFKILGKKYILPSELKCIEHKIIAKYISYDKCFMPTLYITVRCDDCIYEYKSNGIGYKSYRVYKR